MKYRWILGLICLWGGSLYAQSAFDFQQIDAPAIGKLCPDYQLHTLTSNGYKTHSLSAFRGQVVVLEFWATSCRPCIPAMDHLEILEAAFPKKLKVFQISEDEENRVRSFLEKHPTGSTIVLDSTQVLKKAFYHLFLPHTVIIDPKGIVRAFTYPGEVTSELIQRLLDGKAINVRTKQEYTTEASINPKLSKTLNEIDAALDDGPVIVPPVYSPSTTYKADLTPYLKGDETQIIKESDHHIRFVNCPLTLIYQTLYNLPSSRLLLEVPEDKVPNYTFDEKNAFCFDLAIPDSTKQSLQAFGQQHLMSLFPLKAKLAFRNRPVYGLKSIKKQAVASGTKQTLQELLEYLETLPDFEGLPMLNETNLTGDSPFDLKAFQRIEGSLETRLGRFGLKTEKKQKEFEYLVLYE